MRTEFKKELYPELDIIKKEIQQYINVNDISDKSRTRDFVMARWLYIKLAKEFTPYSTIAIGAAIRRDHSTVVHAIANMGFDFKYDKVLQAKHDELTIILSRKLVSNTLMDIDARIEMLNDQINTLKNRKNKITNYEFINTEQQNQENIQIFWS